MKLHLSLLISTFVGGKHLLVCSFRSVATIPARRPLSTEINYALHHRPQPYQHRWSKGLELHDVSTMSSEAIASYESSETEQNRTTSHNKMRNTLTGISNVWRNKSGDSHDVSVFLDCCPHRMAPLSTGKVVKDEETGSYNIACRYHGFEFDAKGQNSKIPMMKAPADGTTQSSKLSKLGMCALAYPTR
eukprot:8422016-Ditylum_brightwellii.AAC.1